MNVQICPASGLVFLLYISTYGRSCFDYLIGKICTSKISLKRCLDCFLHMNVQICPASGLVFLLYISTYGRSCLDYLIGKISLKRCLDCFLHMNVQICPASGLVFLLYINTYGRSCLDCLLYISTYGRSCFDYFIGKICTSKISLKRCLDYLLHMNVQISALHPASFSSYI